MDVLEQYHGYSASELSEMPEDELRRIPIDCEKLPVVDALPLSEYDPDEDAIWEALLSEAS